MPDPAAPPSFTLGLLLYEGCMPAGLYAVADLVAAANLRAGRELLRLRWLSLAGPEGGAVPVAQGPALMPEAALDATGSADLDALLVPGMWLLSEQLLQQQLERQRGLLRALSGLRCALWSYCTGVALLAAAGRLNGHAATATWWMEAPLRRRYPRVDWRFAETLVEQPALCTAAGASGHLPLMLAQLRRWLGPEALREVQEALMLPQPRLRDPWFDPVDLMQLGEGWLRELVLFAQTCPAQSLDLEAAAQALRRSRRSLCRHVLAATGLPAARWLRLVKLRQAAERLAHSAAPLKTIADELGFSSEAALHRMFRQTTGLTPGAYRQTQARQPLS